MSRSTLRPLTIAGIPAATFLALLGVASPAQAATFVVDDASDAHDTNPGNGTCRGARPHGCTLRAAIEEANASPGHDLIRLADATTYTLELGQLLVGTSMTIRGESGAVVDADGSSRVFYVQGGGVTITDLTITGGYESEFQQGAGVYVGGDAQVHLARCVVERNYADQEGSGIANFGSLHVERTSVRDNENLQTDDAGGGVTSTGGGIHNGTNAMLIVEQSAIVHNRAFRGGGINNRGYAWITDSTISGNEAFSRGAGLLVESAPGYPAEVEIERSTITENALTFADTTELVGGAGIANVMAYVSIHASIVADNDHEDLGLHEAAPDCADFTVFVDDPAFPWLSAGEWWSDSYNLMGTLEGCEAFDPATEDILPAGDEPLDPQLGPLAPWTAGGTELHIPSAGSAAIRGGPRCQLPPIPNTPIPDCFDVDQRGYLRSSGEPETDIGAYEGNGTPPPPPRGG